MRPVLSSIVAFDNLAYDPNLVKISLVSGNSRTVALTCTLFIPAFKSLMVMFFWSFSRPYCLGRSTLATLNLSPGKNVYGEKLVKHEDDEYRLWDPYKSKLAAALLKGLRTVPIRSGHKVLYIGAASGTTVSHVSDIVGSLGCVYCIEFSFRPLRDLIIKVSPVAAVTIFV